MVRPISEVKQERVEITLPQEVQSWFDAWWKKQGFVTRNEAMRHLILEKNWQDDKDVGA